jgi:phosphoglycolate phosphatase
VGKDAIGTLCVLFDLDGTLVDSAPGIVDCLAATLRNNGYPVQRASSLTSFVGPPVADTIRAMTGLPEAGVLRAVQEYRALYAQRGIENSTVFPGIFGLLGALRELGIPMAVATSKRESQATAILEHHGLDGFFSVVAGADELDAHGAKSDVIAGALARLDLAGVNHSHTVYVGDRKYDVAGGVATGIPVIFASWGYGDDDESLGAFTTSPSPGHLLNILTHSFTPIGRNTHP